MAETETSAIIAFNGALTVIERAHPRRVFALEATFHIDKLDNSRGFGKDKKPPQHFHPYQEEYVKVLQGTLIVEVEGRAYRLEPGHPEFVVRRWHQEPDPPHEGGAEDRIVRFLLSGKDTEEVFKLDKIFFQNWYGYQNDMAAGKTKFSLMNMFDAGGSYLSLPWWVPFSRTLARALGIVAGRWLGSLLEYQPFYSQWTLEWALACKKMRSSIFPVRCNES
ncbi:hypothetical protein F5Y01DRAFT_307368 [Xylaria sp. FL0043]|nr:hypothetical protein F5Y01DRAFT_307368 [Xylaria sp. FL0043]